VDCWSSPKSYISSCDSKDNIRIINTAIVIGKKIISFWFYESCFFTLSLSFTLSHTSHFLGRIQIRPSQRTLSDSTARTTFNLTPFRTLEGGWLQFRVIIVLDCCGHSIINLTSNCTFNLIAVCEHYQKTCDQLILFV